MAEERNTGAAVIRAQRLLSSGDLSAAKREAEGILAAAPRDTD